MMGGVEVTDLRVGRPVRVRDDIRVFGTRIGTIAAVSPVVPKSIADALRQMGTRANNGELEIGVDFTAENTLANLRADAWFLPQELTTEVIERPYKAASRSKAAVAVSSTAVAPGEP